MSDEREGRSLFRNCRAVQNEVRNVIRIHACLSFIWAVNKLFLHTQSPIARRKN